MLETKIERVEEGKKQIWRVRGTEREIKDKEIKNVYENVVKRERERESEREDEEYIYIEREGGKEK